MVRRFLDHIAFQQDVLCKLLRADLVSVTIGVFGWGVEFFVRGQARAEWLCRCRLLVIEILLLVHSQVFSNRIRVVPQNLH